MRNLTSALIITFAAVLIAGCSGGGQPQGPYASALSSPNASALSSPMPKSGALVPPQVQPQQSTSGPLLYAADGGEVLIYPELGYNQAPIGKITQGVSNAYGLCMDASGNLYVANQNGTVTVYPPGSYSPSATYSQDLYRPLYAIVDQYGDLFVGNGNGTNGGTVVEYKPGSTNAYQVLRTPGTEADGMGFDQQGNLYVAYRKSNGKRRQGRIEKFPPGSTQGQILHTIVHQPQGLIVDNSGNILLVDTVSFQHSVVVFPPGARHPKIKVKLPPGGDPTEIAITQDESELYVSSWSNGTIYVTPYPLTESSTWTELEQPGFVQGIAISNGQVF